MTRPPRLPVYWSPAGIGREPMGQATSRKGAISVLRRRVRPYVHYEKPVASRHTCDSACSAINKNCHAHWKASYVL